ncbi:ATPase [Amylibacter kogurei]|uniref:ATPase n=1 Tax=Paramylibacter kogurei TaxID=1889778 RepID=A0A2G5K6E1_9RHOB|nr:ATPase [Amylibacter kogurei]PIB24582.1 ATPase [Amylibacter kogurei]
MIYKTANDWNQSKSKRVMLFGMSGLGKTHISQILRDQGSWFHYSVDYRIGTRYMGEHIADNFKKEAMRNPFLAELLRSDAIYIAANMKFSDLSPLSTYLGKPGDTSKGGIAFDEYLRRQRLHRDAEINAMKDTVHFIHRAKELYDYDNFVCDTSGSVVEVVDPNDKNDPVMSLLSDHVLPIWIDGGSGHTDVLVERFAKAPKPMYYQEDFLLDCWENYLSEKSVAPVDVNPDDFILWGYQKLLENRLPRYAQIAKNWGVRVDAKDIANVHNCEDFSAVVSAALEAR